MGVVTTVFTIFALVFVFTGHIQAKDWRSILLKLEDINTQFQEQVWGKKTEILAHVGKSFSIRNQKQFQIDKNSMINQQVILLAAVWICKSSVSLCILVGHGERPFFFFRSLPYLCTWKYTLISNSTLFPPNHALRGGICALKDT